MHIYLIRHARQQSVLCNDDTSLCEEGRQQAVSTGERLSFYGIQAVYSSDLLRAEETAGIIRDVLKNSDGRECPLIVKRGLREMDFGELTGLTDDFIAREYADFMESRYHTEEDWGYPQGENGSMVWERLKPVWDEILESGYESIAVVTHGGTIRCLLSNLFGKGFAKRLQFAKRFERGSITEIFYDEKRKYLSLERFNDYAHIENPYILEFDEEERGLPLKKIGEDITLVLASGSARRKELLENLGVPFITIKSNVEEESEAITPASLTKELSFKKALDAAKKITDRGSYVILGADTIVVSEEGNIMGKPENRDDAIGMLCTLEGHTHSVYTGVSLLFYENGQSGVSMLDSFYCHTRVTVAPMGLEEIEKYLNSGEYEDKAGAYAIQGLFAPYIKKIEGDYYNVVGLPLSELRVNLKKHGIEL